MAGLSAITQKELSDHFGSRRFIILFVLIGVAGLSATYVASQAIGDELASDPSSQFVFLKLFTASKGVLPAFISFISFLGPLVGIALGFDAISRERSGRTLSRVLAQPVYRDSVINGKFLAGLGTISIMLISIILIVSGLGMRLLGVVPTSAEGLRVLAFIVVTVLYIAFWMSLAILFSILFRQTATSALSAIAVWIFFAFFMSMIAGLVANGVAPLGDQPTVQEQLRHERVIDNVSRLSPDTLYAEATTTLLSPGVRTLGPVLVQDVIGMVPGPLSFRQSLLLVWPQLTGLVALTSICFAISYAKFMREEIRA